MIVRELLTKFGFVVDNAKLDALSKQIDGVKSGLRMATGAVLAFSGALSAAALKTAMDGDKFAKHSKRIGLTVKEYQELDHAAQLSGTSIEEMQTGLRRMAMTMDGVRRGEKTALDTARRLGVSFRDAAGQTRPVVDVLEDVADRIASMPDGMEKTALAQAAFGRGGNAMVNMLNAGGAGIRAMRQELEDLGGVMSDDVAKASEEFMDAQLRLRTMLRGLVYTVGAEVMPSFTETVKEIGAWWKVNQKLVKTKVSEWLKELIKTTKSATDWLRRMLVRVDEIVRGMGGWELTLKRAAVALGLIGSAVLIAKVLELAKAIGIAAKAMMTLGLAKVPIALVAAAILAIVLALEDLDAYSKGEDSVLGRLAARFKSLKEVIEAAKFAYISLREALGLEVPLDNQRRFESDPADAKPGDYTQWVPPGGEFGKDAADALRSMFQAVGLAKPEVGEPFQPSLGLLGPMMLGVDGIQPRPSMTMAPAQAPAGTVTISAPVTVTVTQPGATPEQVGAAVREGVDEGLTKHLRGALRNLETSEQ